MPSLSADLSLVLVNGRLTPATAKQCGFSAVGCAYRGSLLCARCPWGRLFALWECEYKCHRCEHHMCPCGYDLLTGMIERWFGIGDEEI
jgi:hypothetical protein